MTDIDDGHSPATCNFRRCNAPNPQGPCPFLEDAPLTVDYSQPIECRHDWRQYWRTGDAPDGFYCTKCLQYNDNAIVS